MPALTKKIELALRKRFDKKKISQSVLKYSEAEVEKVLIGFIRKFI